MLVSTSSPREYKYEDFPFGPNEPKAEQQVNFEHNDQLPPTSFRATDSHGTDADHCELLAKAVQFPVIGSETLEAKAQNLETADLPKGTEIVGLVGQKLSESGKLLASLAAEPEATPAPGFFAWMFGGWESATPQQQEMLSQSKNLAKADTTTTDKVFTDEAEAKEQLLPQPGQVEATEQPVPKPVQAETTEQPVPQPAQAEAAPVPGLLERASSAFWAFFGSATPEQQAAILSQSKIFANANTTTDETEATEQPASQPVQAEVLTPELIKNYLKSANSEQLEAILTQSVLMARDNDTAGKVDVISTSSVEIKSAKEEAEAIPEVDLNKQTA